jgi:hypothetical protein
MASAPRLPRQSSVSVVLVTRRQLGGGEERM